MQTGNHRRGSLFFYEYNSLKSKYFFDVSDFGVEEERMHILCPLHARPGISSSLKYFLGNSFVIFTWKVHISTPKCESIYEKLFYPVRGKRNGSFRLDIVGVRHSCHFHSTWRTWFSPFMYVKKTRIGSHFKKGRILSQNRQTTVGITRTPSRFNESR